MDVGSATLARIMRAIETLLRREKHGREAAPCSDELSATGRRVKKGAGRSHAQPRRNTRGGQYADQR